MDLFALLLPVQSTLAVSQGGQAGNELPTNAQDAGDGACHNDCIIA